MWLKSLLEILILPPVNLVFVVLLGLALLRRAPRIGRWLATIGALLLLVLAMPAVAGVLLYGLEQNLPLTPPPGKPPQAIVILGAEIIHTLGSDPGAAIGRLSLERVRAGAELERRTHLPILVSGGTVGPEGPPVADVMRDTLVNDFQVPVRWVEDRSRDTWENARDSAAILRANGIDSVYVVTHAWHERRAEQAFASTRIVMTAAPVLLDRAPTPYWFDFVPRASAWETSYYTLHEWIGRIWYGS